MAAITLTPLDSPLRLDESGTVRIGQTRVTLDTLIASYNDGNDADEIVFQFPSLVLSEVHAAISYYLAHTGEIGAYLLERNHEAEQLRKQVESLSDQRNIRQRLLARRASRKTGT